MDNAHHILERGLKTTGIYAEYPVELFRENRPTGAQVPFHAADAGDPLGAREMLHRLTQLQFGGAQPLGFANGLAGHVIIHNRP